MRQTFELACYRGDCACPNKDHFSHPTANAKAFTPPFVFHNWRTGKNEPLEVWRKESDEAPHCSKRCATAQSKKGHLSSCRRLKALVEGGWMHPHSIKRRKGPLQRGESAENVPARRGVCSACGGSGGGPSGPGQPDAPTCQWCNGQGNLSFAFQARTEGI